MLSLCPAASFSKDMTLDEITAKMEEADRNVNSLNFEFTQEIVYNLTNEKQVASGKVSFMKPEYVRITENAPLEQEIIANGSKVWIYTPKYRQVIVDSWKKWAKDSMIPESLFNFGKSWKELKNKYVISYEGQDGDRYVLLFKPAGGQSLQMRFWVESGSFIPVKVVITGENVTIRTEIVAKTINPKIDKALFNFKAPPGIEVMNLE